MRLYVTRVGDNQQAIEQAGWNKKVEKKLSPTEWKIHLNVYQVTIFFF